MDQYAEPSMGTTDVTPRLPAMTSQLPATAPQGPGVPFCPENWTCRFPLDALKGNEKYLRVASKHILKRLTNTVPYGGLPTNFQNG